MKPAIKDSDLVLYYRLDKNFVSGDVVVFKKNNRIMMSRVVAVAGDQVDIHFFVLPVFRLMIKELLFIYL